MNHLRMKGKDYMALKNFYKILGISQSATQDEVKRAFRNLAKKYHPDNNTDSSANEMMQQITEAYEVLSDITKRKSYDEKFKTQLDTVNGDSVYSSYTETKEKSEEDFEDWIAEYLKRERKKRSNNDFNEKESLIKLLNYLKSPPIEYKEDNIKIHLLKR